MSSTIKVSSLPIVEEVFETDHLVIQSKDRTALVQFDNFVIGEQQVSFYKEIVDARNSITSHEAQITNLNERVAELQTGVDGATSTTTTNSSIIQTVDDRVESVEAELSTAQNSILDLNTAIQNQTAQTNTLNNNAENIQNLNNNLQETINNLSNQLSTLTTEINSLKASVVNINTQLYVMDQRVASLEE